MNDRLKSTKSANFATIIATPDPDKCRNNFLFQDNNIRKNSRNIDLEWVISLVSTSRGCKSVSKDESADLVSKIRASAASATSICAPRGGGVLIRRVGDE